jgi:dTDP-4-amino-4,6-dideoxygalactose transaminase
VVKVPFVDMKKMHDPIRAEIDTAIASVIDRNAYIKQKDLKLFEEELAASLEATKAAGVSSCTAGTQLILEALGIGRGDEVITVVNTAIPTSESITAAGADVVFVDIREGTFNIDPDGIRKAITPKTKAIIPVHLYGFPAPMDEIMDIAREHHLHVIEDVAQAQGATHHDKRLGTIGTIGSFSFFPSKNLGCFGDGGAVAGMDAELVDRVAMLSDHGRKDKYTHQVEGHNQRLDNLQAAVLRIKLRHLDYWNARRRAAAALYDGALADIDRVVTPKAPAEGDSVYHLYVVRVPDRDALAGFLKEREIDTGLHYPMPLHFQPAYGRLGLGPGTFPEAEAAAREVLSLPMFPDISREQIFHVCESIREYYRKN